MSKLKKIIFLGLVTFFVSSVEAQQRFFTLSGGSKGDTASAKYEAQIAEIKDLAKKHAACAISGKVFALDYNGKKHPQADDKGCIDSLHIQENGNVEIKSALSVADSVSIGSETIKDHALAEPLTCTDGKVLSWTGSTWLCKAEADPEVGNLVSGKWCAAQNGRIVCDKDTPATDIENTLSKQVSESVRDFARKDKNALDACSPGEVLTSDGTTLKCASFDILAEGTLKLDDLSDVNAAVAAVGDILYFDGSIWKTGQVVESWARREIKYQISDRCQAGDVLTFDGNNLICIPDIGGKGDAIALGDLADVSGTEDATLTHVLGFNGEHWTKMEEQDTATMPWAKTDVTNLTADACGVDEVLTYDGNVLSCVPDIGGAGNSMALGSLADVSLTSVTNNQMLAFDGTNWVNMNELDSTVQAFAKTGNPLPNCPVGQILTSVDGVSLSCVADADSAAGGIALRDLTDVTLTTPVTGDFLVYTASGWKNDPDAVEGFARMPVGNLTGSQCNAGEVLTYNGTELTCVSGSAVGLWTDNTTHISRDGVHIVDGTEDLPAALEGGGTRTVFYPKKGAFRVGTVFSDAWNDSNVGNYSVAFGLNTSARGVASVALGTTTIALGDNSFSTGINTSAQGIASASFGSNTSAIGHSSSAFGFDTEVESAYASAFGRYNVGGGDQTNWVATDPLFEIGNGLSDLNRANAFTVLKNGNIGIGKVAPTAALDVSGTLILGNGGETCSAGTAGAMRYNATTSGLEFCNGTAWTASSAGGGEFQVDGTVVRNTTDVANHDFLFGSTQLADTGDANHDTRMFFDKSKNAFRAGSVDADQWDDANVGGGSVAFGTNTVASAVASAAFGDGSVASGIGGSTAFGLLTNASGFASTAFGDSTHAEASHSVALGRFNVGGGDFLTWVATDPLFEIGNGADDSNRANAVTVLKNGKTGIGTTTPAELLDVAGNGIIQGNLTIKGALNVSGTQTIDGVVFANGGIEAAKTITATAFIGDGSALTNLNASNLAINIDDLDDASAAGSNLYLGLNAGDADTSGGRANTAIGVGALSDNTGQRNVAIGNSAAGRTHGFRNVAIGAGVLQYVNQTDGVVIGESAMEHASGTNNVTIGSSAGRGVSNSTAINRNVFIGKDTGRAVLTGADDNVFVGNAAGDATTTGARNILIGSGVDASSATASDELNIGNLITGDMAGGSVDISGTLNVAGTVKVAGTGTETCDGAAVGTLRYNSVTGRMQICRP